MRPATMDIAPIRFTEAETAPAAGICLGNAGCAEHGAVPSALVQMLGIGKRSDRGIESRVMSRAAPHAAVLVDNGTDAMLEISVHVRDKLKRLDSALLSSDAPAGLIRLNSFPKGDTPLGDTQDIGNLPLRLRTSPGRSVSVSKVADRQMAIEQSAGFRTFWDDQNGFLLHGRGAAQRQLVLDMAEAYEAGRLVLTTGQSQVFGSHGGLILLDDARIPDEIRAEVLQRDEAYLALRSAVAECGIEETLQAAGLKWFALSPSWVTDEEGSNGIAVDSLEGGDRLVFFLNPNDQLNNHGGWMTFGDLQDWAKGQGVILKANGTDAPGCLDDAMARLRHQMDPEGMTALNAAAEATGVPTMIREGALKVLAIKPHWADAPGGEVIFWVNPRDQDNKRLGWFNPEEVVAMSRGEGPGMRDQDEKAVLKELFSTDKTAYWDVKMHSRPRDEALSHEMATFSR